jgi:hypothetical protein
MTKEKEKIFIDYLKSNFFRVLHVDDIGIRLTPDLDIQIILWNERASIPKRLAYEIEEDGTLGALIEGDCEDRKSIIREVEAVFTIDLEMADSIATSLRELVDELELAEEIENTDEVIISEGNELESL